MPRTRCALTRSAVALVVVGTATIASAVELGPSLRFCMKPVQIPSAKPDDARNRILEQKLRAKLTAAGVQVVAAETVGNALEELETSTHPWFDTVLGTPLPDLAERVKTELTRLLEDRLHCDVYLIAEVAMVRTIFHKDTAYWDGVRQYIDAEPRLHPLLTSERWSMPALSLWITARDTKHDELAFRSGGIEALMRIGSEETTDVLPPDVWLTDESRIDGAIDAALGPGGTGLWNRKDRLPGPDPNWIPNRRHRRTKY